MEERQDGTGQGERQRGSGGAPVDITEFLLARITEDEAVARAALPVPDVESPRWLPANLKRRFGFISGYEVDHIARHDPARVLRECVAKREIIDAAEYGYLSYLAPLAAIYSDHPDYQQKWAA